MLQDDASQAALLKAAVQHVVSIADQAADDVRALLEAQVVTCNRPVERDLLKRAVVALQSHRTVFLREFGASLRQPPPQAQAPARAAADKRRDNPQSWQLLTLVDDREVEQRLGVSRVAEQISQQCETQLRDLGNYMGTLLGTGRADEDRHPLNPERVGEALSASVQAISVDADVRSMLMREFAASMSQAMPTCYDTVIAELDQSGVEPLLWSAPAGSQSAPGTSGGALRSSGFDQTMAPAGGMRRAGDRGGTPAGPGARPGADGAASTSSASPGRYAPSHASTGSAQASAADAALMTLLRRLNDVARKEFDHDELATLSAHGGSPSVTGGREGGGSIYGSSYADNALGDDVPGLMSVNLIRQNRQQLQQAMPAKLDHMVIDVVGSLFDQILSDPRVPPQMARQIGRLQLPVLRVALVDASFFSSRRHPVRRFVNRIASLACPFDDFEQGPGKAFLDRVRELVQDIVDGDFDQPELYTSKLSALEEFVADQHRTEPAANAAAELFDAKESELRIQQRYMAQLRSALVPIPMDDYLRAFVAQVWSQALVATVRAEGAQSPQAHRMRQVAVELVMSVQPKGLPLLRKRFLMQLPGLMRDLNAGMQMIGWPADAQKEFFGQLLPSHADSLKGKPMSELDFNLLGKQVESIFAAPIPLTDTPDSYPPLDGVTTSHAELEPRISDAEAVRVGMLRESAVDWSRQVEVDIDLSDDSVEADSASGPGGVSAEAAAAVATPGTDFAALPPDDTGWPTLTAPPPAPVPRAVAEPPEPPPGTPPRKPTEVDLDLSLATPDPAEPVRGAKLSEHVRVGFAYQMHLHDAWQKVRLSHVSPGRAFFVFTHGVRHQETVSLTARMLRRLCDTNRFRAVENAYLLERATARARHQLAALKSRY